MKQRFFRLEKKRLKEFLNSVRMKYQLIAPVERGIVRFENIERVDQICLNKRSYFPVKGYFFKQNQVLFRFDKAEVSVPRLAKPRRVFFGLRRCDLNAIKRQDIVFIDDAKDPYYTALRENSVLIGYHCYEAYSPYCFCGSMNLEDFFDLMLYDKKGKSSYLLVEVGSDKGSFFIQKYKEFFSPTKEAIKEEEKVIKNSDRLKKKDISKLYDHPEWEKAIKKCFRCSSCTNLCPTCYCFYIYDEVSIKDPKKGERKRQWSSCQLKLFTRVAGDHIFREAGEARFKHRIYHQLEYFKQKYGKELCVGCGRCIEGCPTKIDFVDIINRMKTNRRNNA